MNFLETIFRRCSDAANTCVLQEVRDDGRIVSATGAELLSLIRAARLFLRSAGIKKGDRCALLAPNSIRWAALDLAIMAEGAMVVPLYSRQAPRELVAMMRDCSPSVLCCGDEALRGSIVENWQDAPPSFLFDEIFASSDTEPASHIQDAAAPVVLADAEPVTIIYTSGTSGEAKGVVLSAGNLNYMLPCTAGRLEILMDRRQGTDRVFHYLPFCFCGSWILLLTCLTRDSVLTISTDLTKLTDEMKLAEPDYFLNVPALLERMKAAIEGQFQEWGGIRQTLFERGRQAWLRRRAGNSSILDLLWLAIARAVIFPAIRKKIGPNLKALICGSAPLAPETQSFFTMIGLQVLQVYGLTETTAICTMDYPGGAEPGRVGPAIEGIEMVQGSGDEVLVRGPNIFLGYWNRTDATDNVLRDGWFHTGDQGDLDASGNWRISGRIKNLIVLSSGHNIAPEPIEENLLRNIPGAQQIVVVGNGRSYLSAIVTGSVDPLRIEQTLEAINQGLPHYKRIRGFYLHNEPFTIENGLMTANGKLKRDAIAQRLADQIEQIYHHQSHDPLAFARRRLPGAPTPAV